MGEIIRDKGKSKRERRERESWKEERCGAFLLRRVQSGGAEKQQTTAPNGFSLFVMRLVLLPLPERLVFSGVGWREELR